MATSFPYHLRYGTVTTTDPDSGAGRTTLASYDWQEKLDSARRFNPQNPSRSGNLSVEPLTAWAGAWSDFAPLPYRVPAGVDVPDTEFQPYQDSLLAMSKMIAAASPRDEAAHWQALLYPIAGLIEGWKATVNAPPFNFLGCVLNLTWTAWKGLSEIVSHLHPDTRTQKGASTSTSTSTSR
jgi:hypothetical protein